MNRALFGIVSLMVLLAACKPKEPEEGYRLTPTPDASSPGGIYIPRDIPDAHQELLKMLPKPLIEKMKRGSRDDMVLYHHSLGLWMRNNWGLWSGSRLKQKLAADGFISPDDMSGSILDTFWCHLHGQVGEIDREIARQKRYVTQEKATAGKTNAPPNDNSP